MLQINKLTDNKKANFCFTLDKHNVQRVQNKRYLLEFSQQSNSKLNKIV